VNGNWRAPKAGEAVASPDGSTQTWTNSVANADGWFEGPAMRGGHAFVTYESAAPRIMILEAAGHNSVYVNGEPRAGDLYQYGYVRLPVALRAGTNELLFNAGRGRLRAKLVPPPSPVFFNLGDPTLRDDKLADQARSRRQAGRPRYAHRSARHSAVGHAEGRLPTVRRRTKNKRHGRRRTGVGARRSEPAPGHHQRTH
jgi:hypothetical protein